jgi:hypothetical protein
MVDLRPTEGETTFRSVSSNTRPASVTGFFSRTADVQRREPSLPRRLLGEPNDTLLCSDAADLSTIDELEVQLEEGLLAVDHAEKRGQWTFGPAATIVSIQQRIRQMRGIVAEHPTRRAAWPARVAKLLEYQTVNDGPACVAGLRPRRGQRCLRSPLLARLNSLRSTRAGSC